MILLLMGLVIGLVVGFLIGYWKFHKDPMIFLAVAIDCVQQEIMSPIFIRRVQMRFQHRLANPEQASYRTTPDSFITSEDIILEEEVSLEAPAAARSRLPGSHRLGYRRTQASRSAARAHRR